jgi:hypothetical protein
MATIREGGPQWWDRDVDDQGNPIRADVRQAAHEIWPECCARMRATLDDIAKCFASQKCGGAPFICRASAWYRDPRAHSKNGCPT